MGGGARLAIGAVALIAGVAIFWLSISLWTRERLHAPGALAGACLRERELPKTREHAARYLAHVATRTSHGGPPHLADRVGQILVEHFGFLLIPGEERQRLIGSIRACGAPPAVS